MPLVGGSGGGGSGPGEYCTPGEFGGGGGAGGGAIVIASSASITFGEGAGISANGGAGQSCTGQGGSGSGGAIRIVAPTVTGNTFNYGTSLSVEDGNGGTTAPTAGLVRIESNTITSGNLAGNFNVKGPLLISVPFAVTPPSNPAGEILVSAIAGMPINANPFTFPDATINTTSPVEIDIQAHNIPVGTVPSLYIFSETGADMTVPCSALSGTLDSSTATAMFAFPTGGSRGYVKAIWSNANTNTTKPEKKSQR